MTRQFSTGAKFGSEKGKVQKPARIPPQPPPAGGKSAEAGRIHPPRQIVSPCRVRISIFNHLDFARNSFELCPINTAATLGYNRKMEQLGKIPENNLEKKPVKEGVDFVFNQCPEIASIGSKEQYSEYIDSIFPDSKVKEIFYHGARSKFENFDIERGGTSGRNFGKGVYATSKLSWAKQYASGVESNVHALVVNTQNPFITCLKYSEFHGAFGYIPYNEKITSYIDNDAIINYKLLDRDLLKKFSNELVEYIGEKDENGFPVYQADIGTRPEIEEIVVPNAEQSFILGTSQDIHRFKKFVG